MMAEGSPNMNSAKPVMATDLPRSYPWSTKFRTHNSTVEIIEVIAANERARKNPAIMNNGPIGANGACANTSGKARKVIAEEPPVTVARGSGLTAKIAESTASPAMIEMLLLASPMVNALRTVSSSLLM